MFIIESVSNSEQVIKENGDSVHKLYLIDSFIKK